jgi:hypothetical protein
VIRRLRRPLLAVAAASAVVLSIGVQTPALAGPAVAPVAGDGHTVIPLAPPTKHFTISANPSSLTVTAGQPATSTISTTLTSGQPQTVTLSVSGLPPGASGSFNPPSVIAGGSSTLTISTSTSTPSSTSTVTVTGTSSSATRTTTITLTVNNPSGGGLTLISTDPYTNTTSQHATEVEPDTDGNGTVYVAWQDCRFRSGCPANDIVVSTSTDGTTWSAVTRVPIDATTSTVDHFIPGIGVDKATAGTTAKIGLYYYFYANTACTSATCQLQVGFISSSNGGATWSAPQTLAGPFPLSQIAATTQGRMVGDYISCSVTAGSAVAIFAVGRAPSGGQAFDEAMYTAGGLAVTGGIARAEHDTGPAPTPQAERAYLTTL